MKNSARVLPIDNSLSRFEIDRTGIVAENPVKKVRFFREDNLTERILTEREKHELLKHCNKYLKAIVLTALNTDMRRGEILGLKWSQVDFTSKVITVEKTKSGRSRKIPINSTLESVLGEILTELLTERSEDLPNRQILN